MVFEFDRTEATERLPSLIQEAEKFYGDRFPLKRQDIIDTWLKEEPESLTDWCIAAAQAGFELLERRRLSSFISILHFRNSKLS
jgi:DNA-binding SARP family transcriptional activator